MRKVGKTPFLKTLARTIALGITCCATINTVPLFSGCSSNSQNILYIKTETTTYYSVFIYSTNKQAVYYMENKEKVFLDVETLPCEQRAVQAYLESPKTHTTAMCAYDYIAEKYRIDLELVKKSIFDFSEDNFNGGSEEDIADDWLNFQEGFIRSQSAITYNTYTTYSKKLQTNLYMDVEYSLSKKKYIKIKENKNTYDVTYYQYFYNPDNSLNITTLEVAIPINTVKVIQYE